MIKQSPTMKKHCLGVYRCRTSTYHRRTIYLHHDTDLDSYQPCRGHIICLIVTWIVLSHGTPVFCSHSKSDCIGSVDLANMKIDMNTKDGRIYTPSIALPGW